MENARKAAAAGLMADFKPGVVAIESAEREYLQQLMKANRVVAVLDGESELYPGNNVS